MDNLDRILADADADGFVDFGDVARLLLNMQCQYASYYLRGAAGFLDLSEGVRIQGDPADYHSLLIHRDDVAGFVAQAQAHRAERGF